MNPGSLFVTQISSYQENSYKQSPKVGMEITIPTWVSPRQDTRHFVFRSPQYYQMPEYSSVGSDSGYDDFMYIYIYTYISLSKKMVFADIIWRWIPIIGSGASIWATGYTITCAQAPLPVIFSLLVQGFSLSFNMTALSKTWWQLRLIARPVIIS